MKILIIRFSSIGDIVLTTPIIRCLKKQIPNAEVHYLTKAGNANWLQHNIYIDKLFTLEGDLQPVVLDLLKERYDYVIDLHHNLRSRFVKSMLKQQYNARVQCFSVNKLNVRKWLRVHTPINNMPDRSIVDRYFDTVKPLGVTNDGAG
ncbi:MAG: glycosyltransferase family 9 protein, partial [Chitinophagaceae bacterium]|nr:glycosyltransferase family 9 protein [Chitinophagaceae bacterium]